MTKFSLTILMLLNDNDVGSTSKAMSVSQILSLMDDKQRKSYSTTYRHLYNKEDEHSYCLTFNNGISDVVIDVVW